MPYKDKARQTEAVNRLSTTVTIRFVRSTDADILDWLKDQEHPSSAIKKILREALEDGRLGN